MIDTTSVNYAIHKVSEALQKVTPTIQDVGGKYVKYVVTKQVIYGALDLLGFFIAIVLALIISFKTKKWMERHNPIPGVPMAIVCGLIGILSLICIDELTDSILALINPEMFTVNQLIESARGK